MLKLIIFWFATSPAVQHFLHLDGLSDRRDDLFIVALFPVHCAWCLLDCLGAGCLYLSVFIFTSVVVRVSSGFAADGYMISAAAGF